VPRVPATTLNQNPLPICSIEELAISADEALMIGDTQIDMAMAKAAGMDRLGVTMGVHNAAQLNEFTPIATADNYQQLQQLLLS
jgi:phosphoglycolate phosphatase